MISRSPGAALRAAAQDNLLALHEHLLAPCLGEVPYQALPDFRVAAEALDGGMLLY